jgi:surfeit locus 1 family protein
VTRRLWAFVVLAVVLAVVFVRLGFWQLQRLGERAIANLRTATMLAATPVAYGELPAANATLRRAWLEGTPDTDREFALLGRSRDGSPGVHIFTPVRVAGSDTAVLVNRGWVYSPDASTVDLARWREPRSRYRGYTSRLPEAGVVALKGRGMRTLSAAAVDSLLPYPFQTLYLVSQDSMSDRTPARLPPPDLSNGPHLSYAVQWFAFALIALVGAVIVVRRSRASRPS